MTIRFIAPAACLALVLVGGTAGAASYAADPAQSTLEFIGVQEGAEFKGVFHKFTAAIDFDPNQPAAGRFDVQIEIASEDTKDKDRDATIRSADILDAARAPTARYVTRSIAKSAAGYTAQGSLTLRGVTKDVPLDFKFTPGAGGARLEGTAKLRRLDFGAGQGDWKSTAEVADLVKVNFSLTLKPKT